MGTTRLDLYNGALMHCGERELASLTENREPRRLLDAAWSRGFTNRCLSRSLWTFAIRTVRIDYTPSVEPGFGYRRAFQKSDDWMRTAAVCTDEYFNAPLTRYEDERGYLYADQDELYCRFVSNGASYGGDLANWSDLMVEWAEVYLATLIVKRLTEARGDLADLHEAERRAFMRAESQDAMQQPARFLPASGWALSRGRGSLRADRTGSRTLY